MSSIMTNGLPEELSIDEWWRLNTALAHYEVHLLERGKTFSAFAYLVCQAMVSSPLQSITAIQIIDLLKSQFGGHWVIGEINSALQQLQRAGYIKKVADPSGDKFYVEESYRIQSIRDQNETERLRDDILTKWAKELREKHAHLSEGEHQCIIEDLINFCVAIFDRRGAECAALLYSGESEKQKFLKKLETEDLPSLPIRPINISKIRDAEVIGFFYDSKGERSRFIGHFLHSSFLKNAITIDPKFFGILSKQFKDSTIVLDTNFLFSLFGQHGLFKQEIAMAVIQFSAKLGIRLLVHRVTIREFRQALESSRRLLESFPMPNQELATAVTQVIVSEDLFGTYYRRYAATGVRWDDWIQPILAIEARLPEFGIEVTDMYQQEIEADQQLIDEANNIYEVSHDYFERLTSRPLSRMICKHDAFLRLFTARLRRGKPEEFIQAGAWCITCDNKLPRYERIQAGKLQQVSVFVLAEHWLHFVQPIMPRTEDWDALARSLLLSSALQTPVAEGISIERIHRAACCIAEYRDMSAQLAMRVLLNSRFQEAIKAAPDTEFEQKVGGAIEEALLEEYYKQEEQLNLAVAERDKLQDQISKHATIEAELRSGLEALRGEVTNQIVSAKRFYAALVVAFLIIGGVSLDWGALKPVLLGIAIAGMVVGIITVIGIFRGWKLAWNVFLGIAAFVSILAAIVSLRYSFYV
ncbi:MAG: hypothetical protein FJ006_11485 [Chloroflexi bacterium]|nr:hypothetical protein [Chloroflexota bacterium]